MSNSLDAIIEGFNPSEPRARRNSISEGAPIGIWLPAAEKARYDRLQQISQRSFCKKVRELIIAAMDVAELKA